MRELRRIVLIASVIAVLLICSGCGNLPGHPTAASIPIDPDNVTDFSILFSKNCSGCHGTGGKGGPALSITDPVYLSIANDAVLRKVVSDGIAGTSMPAFAKSAGGMLTDNQVDTLVRGLREHYARPDALNGVPAPPYSTTEPGDVKRGSVVYDFYCASCHGVGGKGGKASSIVDGSFLALLTDQELRTLVIVGRPDFGAPDWRNNVPGRPMTAQDISDVVAWLASLRPEFPGRPYVNTTKTAGEAQ